ncbi:MAG: crotonobetainyl-CoA:carnitine CoA-transferase CaiB-like acyl-CoA transferase [Gammaproteobacteria bacterium]|jgi:crotonobetainyl-CoA:carnitine CoA-transferase CaiB-like acyl-CoA transferase
MPSPPDNRPLAGVRVLELGQLIAGPFAGCVLGYFGAEVIKVEPPGDGDALRNWRELDDDGTSFWWRSMARNKRCVTINLREERGRELVHDLAMKSDVVLENFRPGTMEKWGLGPERYRELRPQLVYTRVSGYGQSGPYASRPGFASACEGFGGFRYINGFPDEAPVRPNLSMGDTLAAMNAIIGTLMALLGRARPGGAGQVVDVAIYESVFNMLESVVPEFDGAGVVREPSGTTLTGIVPTNTYRCADGRHVVIGGNGDSIFKRLMHTTQRPDLADDPRLANNAGRVRHQREVDDAISAWTGQLKSDDVLAHLDAASVPNGPINSVREIMDDPHFQARGMFESVQVGKNTLKIPAMTPQLGTTPGRTEFAGPELGAHNGEVFRDLLGLTSTQIQQLNDAGVI